MSARCPDCRARDAREAADRELSALVDQALRVVLGGPMTAALDRWRERSRKRVKRASRRRLNTRRAYTSERGMSERIV